MARRLRVALAEDGRQDREIAELASVTAEWLGSVKQGVTKNPPMDKLRAVAIVLGKQTRYFTETLGYVPTDEEAGLPPTEAAVLATFRAFLREQGEQDDPERRQHGAAASGS